MKYFTTEKRPITVDGVQLKDRVAIIRTDTKDCIGIVHPGFKIVNDNELIDNFFQVMKKNGLNGRIVKRTEIRGGRKTITEIEFPESNIRLKKKDELHLRVYLTNGYDGYSSAKLMLGFFRLVCSNGMVIGTKELSIAYKHVGRVNEKLTSQFDKYIMMKIKEAENQIKHLNSHVFENARTMEYIIEKTPILGISYTEKVMEALESEKMATPLSAWHLYNAYTKVITHDMGISQDNRLQKLKSLNKHFDSIINQ